MRKLLIFVLLIFPAVVFAQTGEELDKLLQTREVSYAAAARFVLPAAGILPDDVDAAGAFAEAQSRGWTPKALSPESPLNLAGFSYLLTRAFEIKGGMMYSLFPGPRYAYRELVHKKVIQGRSDPQQTVSGQRLILILGRVLDYTGEEL